MGGLSDRAARLAEAELASALPRRWAHVCAVAKKAEVISRILERHDREVLIASAWLHDIGYAPAIVSTGLHALDGARWLLSQDIDRRIAALVAHHSCALFEAEERELAVVLTEEFHQERSSTADALWYSDMTTGPDGQDVSVAARMAEISSRYGPDDVVTKFWVRAKPTLFEAIERVERLLAAQPM